MLRDCDRRCLALLLTVAAYNQSDGDRHVSMRNITMQGRTRQSTICHTCGKRRPCSCRTLTERSRKSSWKRGYDRDWANVREKKLAMNPICEDCLTQGLATPAIDVHHVKKVSENPDLRLDLDNLRSLCKPCHSVRTGRGE